MSDYNFNYENLPPFKWFVLENFPFIEADFDALTNWQLFCKLGNEMNKIIESVNTSGEQVETLTNAFISLLDSFADYKEQIDGDVEDLENFVNNYFDNLDVQEEINNKLDEMAEDGTLTTLIGNYVSTNIMPLINQQNALIDAQNTAIETQNTNIGNVNTQIGALSDRIDAFTNLTSGSTTGDAELIDGRTSFDGITYANIGGNIRTSDSKINNRLNKYINTNLLQNAVFTRGILDNNGNIYSTSSDYYSTTVLIPVEPNTKYYFNSARIVLWYSNTTTVLSKEEISSMYANNLEITSPATASYCKVTVKKSIYDDSSYTMNKIKDNFSDFGKEKIKYSIGKRVNMLYGLTPESGYLSENTPQTNASYKYYPQYLPVKANHTYRISPRVRFACYYTNSYTVTYTSDFPLNSNPSYGPQSITPTSDGYVRISVYADDYNNGKCTMEDITDDTNSYPVNSILLNDDYIPNSNTLNYIKNIIESELSGKKVYNFGDSIGAGDGNSGVGYAELLQQTYNTVTTDYAVGGATISKVENQEMSSVLDQIDNASSTQPDIILLEGGANDYTQTRVMGDVTGETVFTQNSFDETTYIGGLEKCLYKLHDKYPGIPIIWIYTHRENTRTEKTVDGVTVNFTTMHDKSLNACKKWSIPVVDIYNASGLNTQIEYLRTHYTYNSDGTHPNETGYNKFYIPFIKSKIIEVLNLR